MPTKPLKVCSTPGCPYLSQGGKCDKCKVKYGTDQRSTPWRDEEQRWRSWARWKGENGRRLRQLRREPLCRHCVAEGKVEAATDADHIVPARGDYRSFWTGELQSLCRACHSAKTAKEGGPSITMGG